MRNVIVIGIGATPINEHWQLSLRELAGEAGLAAMHDAGLSTVESIYVGNMMSGSANHQQHLGSYIGDWLGLKFNEAVRIEAACSSSAAAFRSALIAVASGQVDSAMAIGVEKMTDSPGSEITAELATAADADWEGDHGVSFVALNALVMQRYMHEYGWKHEHFANFSINAHQNALHNPLARFHSALTFEKYENASMVADPIQLFDASPMGDGAAAILIAAEDAVLTTSKDRIRVLGSAAATDSIAVHGRKDPLWLSAAEKSAKQAYAQAGVTPQDIDLFEYHDAFTIMASLSLEASGFAERGQAPRLALDGAILPGGRIPVATRGGLKARGHPVGATGMYQIFEVIQQLRREAGQNQIENANIGMAQNIGGSGSNIITHIFGRA
ncbi:MAG: thiolase domain-containing protein [Anaerolineaceae bacterium]|nr:thiolase domain-containing protein [Anaerolineaceae bacterium]